MSRLNYSYDTRVIMDPQIRLDLLLILAYNRKNIRCICFVSQKHIISKSYDNKREDSN